MIEYGKAFKAGILGAFALTLLMYIARAMDVTALNTEMVLGSLLTHKTGAGSWILGFMLHLVIGGLLAEVYAFAFEFLTERSGMWIGAGFGLVHASFAGMAMFLLGSIHPLMRNHGVLPAPGPFAINYGALTAVAFIAVHAVYGAWVGSLYPARTVAAETDVSEEMPRAA